MTTYLYTRSLNDGAYNINNIHDVDQEGNSVLLCQRINEDLDLAHHFKIKCFETTCEISFNFELSSEEKTRLDNIVATHQSKTEV